MNKVTKMAAGYDLLTEKLRANAGLHGLCLLVPSYLQCSVVFKITNWYLTFSTYSTTGVTYARNVSFSGQMLKTVIMIIIRPTILARSLP